MTPVPAFRRKCCPKFLTRISPPSRAAPVWGWQLPIGLSPSTLVQLTWRATRAREPPSPLTFRFQDEQRASLNRRRRSRPAGDAGGGFETGRVHRHRLRTALGRDQSGGGKAF